MKPEPKFKVGDEVELIAMHKFAGNVGRFWQGRIDTTPKPNRGVVAIVDWDVATTSGGEAGWSYQVDYGCPKLETQALLLWTDPDVLELVLDAEAVDAAIASIIRSAS